MKVFLCGGGDGEEIRDAYRKFNEVIDNSKPLLYIPLAMEEDKYDSCYEWITNELKDVSVPKIEMVRSSEELIQKDLNNYSAIFIGGGNTFKLLYDLKRTGAFYKIKDYLDNDGVVFGGSAGTIIFGENLNSCKLDDTNDVGLEDITGFNILNGISLLCHYTNRTEEKDEESRKYLLELSKDSKIIALPEEDTLYFNDGVIEVIGRRPYYVFEYGNIIEFNSDKNVEEEFISIKTPDDLMNFMNNNIVYGWIDKNNGKHINSLYKFRENYRISPIDEVFRTGLGTCIEQAKIIKHSLESLGFETKLYCHRGYESEDNFDKEVRMHCFVLFYSNGKWYHFEHSNIKQRGINPYLSIEDAIRKITSDFEENDIRELTEIDDIEEGLTFKEFNQYVNSFDKKYLK